MITALYKPSLCRLPRNLAAGLPCIQAAPFIPLMSRPSIYAAAALRTPGHPLPELEVQAAVPRLSGNEATGLAHAHYFVYVSGVTPLALSSCSPRESKPRLVFLPPGPRIEQSPQEAPIDAATALLEGGREVFVQQFWSPELSLFRSESQARRGGGWGFSVILTCMS